MQKVSINLPWINIGSFLISMFMRICPKVIISLCSPCTWWFLSQGGAMEFNFKTYWVKDRIKVDYIKDVQHKGSWPARLTLWWVGSWFE